MHLYNNYDMELSYKLEVHFLFLEVILLFVEYNLNNI